MLTSAHQARTYDRLTTVAARATDPFMQGVWRNKLAQTVRGNTSWKPMTRTPLIPSPRGPLNKWRLLGLGLCLLSACIVGYGIAALAFYIASH